MRLGANSLTHSFIHLQCLFLVCCVCFVSSVSFSYLILYIHTHIYTLCIYKYIYIWCVLYIHVSVVNFPNVIELFVCLRIFKNGYFQPIQLNWMAENPKIIMKKLKMWKIVASKWIKKRNVSQSESENSKQMYIFIQKKILKLQMWQWWKIEHHKLLENFMIVKIHLNGLCDSCLF